MVSGRMVVERREVGEVGSVSGAGKLIGRLQELRQLYPRVCVILEEEATKEGKKAWSVQSAIYRVIWFTLEMMESRCNVISYWSRWHTHLFNPSF